jgi:hypothetical protein
MKKVSCSFSVRCLAHTRNMIIIRLDSPRQEARCYIKAYRCAYAKSFFRTHMCHKVCRMISTKRLERMTNNLDLIQDLDSFRACLESCQTVTKIARSVCWVIWVNWLLAAASNPTLHAWSKDEADPHYDKFRNAQIRGLYGYFWCNFSFGMTPTVQYVKFVLSLAGLSL